MIVWVTAHEVTSHNLQHAPSTRQETQVGAVKLKDGTRKGFSEDIGAIICTRYMRKSKVLGINVRTNKMKSNVDVFGAIVGNTV